MCQLGDTGLGGGVLFYVASSPFTCGANMALLCNYLEVAPNLWAPNSSSACDINKNGACGGSNQYISDFSYSGGGITLCKGTDWAPLRLRSEEGDRDGLREHDGHGGRVQFIGRGQCRPLIRWRGIDRLVPWIFVRNEGS